MPQSSLCKNRTDRSVCATWLLDGLGLGYVSEEVEDAALEFGWLEADGGGVEGSGDFPELFGAYGGGVDALGVAAGEGFVFFIADEEDGEGAGGDGFFGGNFGDGEAGEFFAAVEEHPAKGREERFAEYRGPA